MTSPEERPSAEAEAEAGGNTLPHPEVAEQILGMEGVTELSDWPTT